MSNQQIKILGVNVSSLTFHQVLEEVEKYLQKRKKKKEKRKNNEGKLLVIFTPNPEIVVYAQKDEKFKEIVNTAQINIPDGVGLILAAKFLGKPLKEKISGVDLMEKLVELAARQGLTVGLIGGREGVALEALECLQEKYPGLKGWAEEGPTIKLPMTNDQLPNLKPCSILFVGLGCPKQEYFINILNTKYLILNTPLVLMAVGGSFDYLSGRVKRAPLFIRKIGFEWVWRLVLQPWRLKRQLSLVKFVRLILKQKLDKIF